MTNRKGNANIYSYRYRYWYRCHAVQPDKGMERIGDLTQANSFVLRDMWAQLPCNNTHRVFGAACVSVCVCAEFRLGMKRNNGKRMTFE